MPTAYSYVRFSSTGQRRGTSEARQDETPEPWCKANGYTLDTSLKLKDLGRSGYHGEHVTRGALGPFLQLVKDGAIERGSVLLIEHLDRLTRQDPDTAYTMISSIINSGIDIVTLMDGERYTQEKLRKDIGCSIKLMLTLFQSNQESDKKSDRLLHVWRKKRQDAREGKRITTRCPSWLDKKTRKVIEPKAEIIRRLYRMAADGLGAETIARQLNREGAPTLCGAKKWYGGSVAQYLHSRAVIGELQLGRMVPGKRKVPEGEPIPNYYPAIVDPALFSVVQRQLADRSARTIRGTTDKMPNLFVGLLYSLYDGGRYHANKKSLIPYNRRLAVPDSMTIPINLKSFEQSFFKFVREVDVSHLFTREDQADKAALLEKLQGDMIDIDDTIEQTKKRVRTSRAKGTLYNLIEELDDERREKSKQIETLKSELTTSEARVFEDLRAALDDPGSRAKIAASLRMLIDRIELLPIHVKTGQCQRNYYYLYVHLYFHNGKNRFFWSNQDGDQIALWDLEMGPFYGNFGPALGLDSPDYQRHDDFRRGLIHTMIYNFASTEWKERLLRKFHEYEPCGEGFRRKLMPLTARPIPPDPAF